MILQFIIAALLLLIIFGVVMLLPFIKAQSLKSIDQDRRNQLNHDLYEVRLEEVESDLAQGVINDKAPMITELQHNLLDDINESGSRNANEKKLIWLPGILFFIMASIGLYVSVGGFNQVNDWENSLKRYPVIYQELFENSNARPDEQDLKDLMLGLRTHLANKPEDAKNWVLYSRLGRVFDDNMMALDAIKKAFHIEPDNFDIELEYIELKMKVGDDYSQKVAEQMLGSFVQRHPEDYDAWSMYGFIALQQDNFTAAIVRWQKMLTLVAPDSEQAITLANSIDYAKEQLLLQEESGVSEEVEVLQEEYLADPVSKDGAYNVTVTLNDKVTYPKNSTLFVYAQAVTGPKMPIAAIKLPITSFPVGVVLSDADAMVQGNVLSAHEEFLIKARISSDGSVNKSAGQWSGQSVVINKGETKKIWVEINEKL